MLTLPIFNQIFLLTSTLSFKYIEPNHYYYLDGTNVVLDDGFNGHEIFTLFPYLIIDLLSDYYVRGVFFQFRNEYGTSDDIWAKCSGMTTHSEDVQDCENNDMVGRTIQIICECSTRFIGVQTEVRFDVAYINVTGREMFSAFYAGCYESSLTGGGYLVEDLSECILGCHRLGYSLAGVKKRFCYCFNGFTGTIVNNNMCIVQCLELQLCGSERHIMLYFTDYFPFVEQRMLLTAPGCVFYEVHCKECPAGRIGLSCDIIDCSNANGNCGDKQCDQFDVNPLIGGLCRCPPGFEISDRWNCSDIDECDRGFSGCSENLICKNTFGTYICMCNIGYSKVERKCEDIDECASGLSVCGDDGTCENTVGTYICRCNIGYSNVENNCEDINECASGLSVCGDYGTCWNILGTYICTCNIGYSNVENGCEDIDECASGLSVCDDDGTCNNTFGTYICMCRMGYSSVESVCKDIDECLEGQAICGDNKNCINSDGSYFCDCAEGFAEEDDECIELSNISFRDKRLTKILGLSFLTGFALVTIPIAVFIFAYKVCKREATGSRVPS